MANILQELKNFKNKKEELSAFDEIAISMGLISIHKSFQFDRLPSDITSEELPTTMNLIKRGNKICEEALVYLKSTAQGLVLYHLGKVKNLRL
ncbi:hypothetical protein CROQUDRAFT_357604 [Cronartium quercuum f. sp. fusiforme G11]|uniref:Uncharacterized protein n=1 Tax=Cronartium quercuum f. sp. fusiforme G11 TaxID=708437 RepID=A0A9P6T5Z0_9BASI|nr:hypothetical protein CROQUDRAFT_357604 [Cronartium quercuum f. sp. fusiforme G11]